MVKLLEKYEKADPGNNSMIRGGNHQRFKYDGKTRYETGSPN